MNKNTAFRTRLIQILPFIIAALVMLPRLVSPQFGFLDDARMLSEAKHILQGSLSMDLDIQAGRFRPLYWLYYTFIYSLAGYHPIWYFLGNLILFFVLLLEIRALLKKMAFTDWQILLTSLVFVFSMPIIENFYSLGKGEPLQLVLLLLSLILLDRIQTQRTWYRRMGLALLAAICILLAILVKETALVIIPIAILWWVILMFSRDETLKAQRPAFLYYSGAALLAGASYFFLRVTSGATALLGGTYTNRYLVAIGALLEKLLRWMTQYAFNFHYLVPLALLILALWILRKLPKGKKRFDFYRWIIWGGLWAVILIPWEYAELYYLLPFALGSSILIGWIAKPILIAIQTEKKGQRYLLAGLSVLTCLLFILTLPNYRTDAKTQMTFDQVNQSMLDYVVENFSDQSTIYMNLESGNEYSEKLEIFLREHYQMESIKYGVVGEVGLEQLTNEKGAVILMPAIENQPNLTVRAGVEETYQNSWNEHVLAAAADELQTLQTFSESFQLTNINLPILICPLLGDRGFCESPDPLIDTRDFAYSWEIFQLNGTPSDGNKNP